MFVIRDFTDRTPLKKLADTLINDLRRVWEGLVKPPGRESALITDFFDFEYVGLPHKIYASSSFDAGVEYLKSRFYDSNAPTYVFKPIYHKGIPIDGFPHFANAIWEKIINNRDLDLPTQQELLAQYRCDEIAKTVFDKFSTEIRPLKKRLGLGQVVADLGSAMFEMAELALKSFDKDASRYNQSVFKTKQADFLEQIHVAFYVLYVQQLRNVHKKAIQLFNESLQAKLKGGDDSNFVKKLNTSLDQAKDLFDSTAKQSLLDKAAWTYDEQLALFTDEINEQSNQQRLLAMERLTKKVNHDISHLLGEAIQSLFNRLDVSLWKDVNGTFQDILDGIVSNLRLTLEGFDVDKKHILNEVVRTKINAWDALNEIIKKNLEEKPLIDKLKLRFILRFLIAFNLIYPATDL